VQERAPVTHLRALRDAKDALGFSRELWRELAGARSRRHGDPGSLRRRRPRASPSWACARGAGRNLVPTPFLSTAVLGAGAVLLAGSEAQKRALLPGVCTGERLLALAIDEGTRHGRA
jgi:alkylation response protein AidB-like acyl-CoA dehydrogenase